MQSTAEAGTEQLQYEVTAHTELFCGTCVSQHFSNAESLIFDLLMGHNMIYIRAAQITVKGKVLTPLNQWEIQQELL